MPQNKVDHMSHHNAVTTVGTFIKATNLNTLLSLNRVSAKSYYMTSTMYGLIVEPIDYYVALHYRCFTISAEDAMANMQDVARFYESLDSGNQVHIVKTIFPPMQDSADKYLLCDVIQTGQVESVDVSSCTSSTESVLVREINR